MSRYSFCYTPFFILFCIYSFHHTLFNIASASHGGRRVSRAWLRRGLPCAATARLRRSIKGAWRSGASEHRGAPVRGAPGGREAGGYVARDHVRVMLLASRSLCLQRRRRPEGGPLAAAPPSEPTFAPRWRTSSSRQNRLLWHQKKLPMVNSKMSPRSSGRRLVMGMPHSKRKGPMGLNHRNPKPTE